MNSLTRLQLGLLLSLMTLAHSSLPSSAAPASNPAKESLATVGGGCFWCVEAVFERVPGVKSVASGYAGGPTDHVTYEQICTGTTGHAEVIQIAFDPAKVSFEKLLDLFWKAHDPTTLNRQGADTGPQYRSIILYHDEDQKKAAEKSKAEAAKRFSRPIVTEIVPLKKFIMAEGYHQDYFRLNPRNRYCSLVIQPKLEKLEQGGALPKTEGKKP